jgi:hypothetical protein
MEKLKLPPELRAVGACVMRFCCGALFVFEVRWQGGAVREPLRRRALLIADFLGNTSTLMRTRSYRGNYISLPSEVPHVLQL